MFNQPNGAICTSIHLLVARRKNSDTGANCRCMKVQVSVSLSAFTKLTETHGTLITKTQLPVLFDTKYVSSGAC